MVKGLPLREPPPGRSSSTQPTRPFMCWKAGVGRYSLPATPCSVAIEVSGRRCDAGQGSLGSAVRSRVIATSRLLPRDTRLATSRRATSAGACVIAILHTSSTIWAQASVEHSSHGRRTNGDAMQPIHAKQSVRRPSRNWSDREVRPPAGASSSRYDLNSALMFWWSCTAFPKASTLRHPMRAKDTRQSRCVRFLTRPELEPILSAPMRQPGSGTATKCVCCFFVPIGLRLPESIGLNCANATWSSRQTLPPERGFAYNTLCALNDHDDG